LRNFIPPNFVHICSGDLIENNEMGGRVGRMGERKGVFRILVVKPEGRKTQA